MGFIHGIYDEEKYISDCCKARLEAYVNIWCSKCKKPCKPVLKNSEESKGVKR